MVRLFQARGPLEVGQEIENVCFAKNSPVAAVGGRQERKAKNLQLGCRISPQSADDRRRGFHP